MADRVARYDTDAPYRDALRSPANAASTARPHCRRQRRSTTPSGFDAPEQDAAEAADRTSCRSSARRWSSCPTTALARAGAARARCATRSTQYRAHAHARRPAPPDAVHRQADARASTPRRCARPWPRPSSARRATTLPLHEAERWRDELIADDEALTRWMQRARRHATRSTCAAWCAQRAARTPRCRPSSATARAYRELFQFIRGRALAEA